MKTKEGKKKEENSFGLDGIELQENIFMPEMHWWNVRLKNWVSSKYLSRTKNRELRPFLVYMGSKLVGNPVTIKSLIKDLENSQ